MTARSRTRSVRPALALLVGVALTACSGPSEDAAGPQSPSTPAATSPAPSPTAAPTATGPTPTPAPTGNADSVTLDATCEMPAQGDVATVTLHHPTGWDVGGDGVDTCSFFAPDDPGLEPNTEPDGVDVRWSIEPVPFARVVRSDRATRNERHVSAVVDGHRAVRTTATSTGAAALPEGVQTTTWAVDLSRSSGGDATLIGTARDEGAGDYRQAVRVLDAMARQAQIGDDSASSGDTTVARWAGRDAFSVAYRADEGCLELYAGQRQGSRVDRACGLNLDGASLEVTILRGNGLEVVAGVASPDVDLVRLRANTDARRAGLAVDVDGAVRAFALPISGSEVTAIAMTFDGEQVDSVEVLPE